MTGTVAEFKSVMQEDRLGVAITDLWLTWDGLRQLQKQSWEEVRRYVYATDTTQTTNSKLPWKNKTTIPKLCHIRDNLYANYSATLHPKRKWLTWEANEKSSNDIDKREAIINYMAWAIEQPSFKKEMDKIILDYIDFGNCFGTIDWQDQRVEHEDGTTQAGYVGPVIKRINPLNIVFNPTAESFDASPKIIKSIISLGELKEYMQRVTGGDMSDEWEALYNYFFELRRHAGMFEGDWSQFDNLYQMDGFTSFQAYLMSGNIEVLTFYGDWYDSDTGEFQKNRVITVVDRHKVIGNKPNPSYFGYPPIFHAAWRVKPDNLWGMGPLANLVGMQYKLDHLENLRADIMDFAAFPVQKIKGFVEEYSWAPGAKIFINEEGDVDIVQAEVSVIQIDSHIEWYQAIMEMMAGAPKEAVGFRTPGEKTKYEFQSLENAAARIFQNKITYFQEMIVEPLLNGCLELSQRNLSGTLAIRVFDDEFNYAAFQQLTVQDITGIGRIRPIAARHFAEQSQLVQNLTGLANSPLWAVVQPHFSSIRLAKIFEDVFDLKQYGVVTPNIAIAEQADAQRQVNMLQEQLMVEQGAATGIGEDFDMEELAAPQEGAPPQ